VKGAAPVLQTEASVDPCPICTGDEPDCLLECGHAFHVDCLRAQLSSRWTGVRVTFDFMGCALCRKRISVDVLREDLKELEILEEKIRSLAIDKAREEDLTNGLDNKELEIHALDTLAFYICAQCKEPFCGGLKSCASDLEGLDVDSLKCQACVFGLEKISDEMPDLKCKSHGYKFAMFKCDSCCSIATYDCIYNHYCDRCHGMASAAKDFPCPGPAKCSLGIRHPPNSAAVHCQQPYPVPYVIGCMKCIGFDEENQVYGSAPHIF